MSNFIQRAITGIIFIAVIGIALLLGPVTYAMLMVCVVSLATNEFCRMIRTAGLSPHFYSVLGVNVVSFALSFLIYFNHYDPRFLLAIVVMIWAVFIVELYCKNENPLQNVALTLLSTIYIGLPFALFNLLAFKNGVYDWKPVVLLFVLVWVNDTGAYITGVTLGKHKLCERISPKKTIEGFAGGVVLTMLAAYLLSIYTDIMSTAIFIITGLSVAVIGTAGDLIESMFKRSVKVKDSGTLLPGHGGILDRFDAIMFAVPIVSLLYYFFT
ncbi:MAG: phosphatidate cytidylyltransferase [Bacteroidales bacterium]|jgi:phosphatidate cytidylyltransferase|nr:phosphatidate cytidylyltransferase [Bacteroidales bacterium]